MKLAFLAWFAILCLQGSSLHAQKDADCGSYIPDCLDANEINLTFVLDLSGCNCVSQFENIQAWKRLNHEFGKTGKVRICACTLSKKNDSLGELYGFRFNFIEARCKLSSRSMTLIRDHGQIVFLKNGSLSISDYLFVRALIRERISFDPV